MTRPTSPLASRPLRTEHALSIVLRREESGEVFAVESVVERDLAEARAEHWFEAALRQGRPDLPLAELDAEIVPVPMPQQSGTPPRPDLAAPDPPAPGASTKTHYVPEPRWAGYAFQTPGGRTTATTRSVFGVRSLRAVADRAADRALERGVIATGERYLYELCAEPRDTAAVITGEAGEATQQGGVRVVGRNVTAPPLAVAKVRLAPLLAGAEAVGGADDSRGYPVFYTTAALEHAERVSRHGGAENPPVETGGLLAGPLCSDPETGELFAVVVDVFEAAHAERTTYSLTYSGETWARVQAVLAARQAQPETRSHRILGQCHGHSFLPADGAAPCELCPSLAVCTRTTAFLSQDDLDWCRAVFHGQPWQLSHIFGLNARAEEVDAFFGQRHGRLVPRGYYLIDRFEPNEL